MKALHINDYRSAGGCEVLMHDTTRWLSERGWRVDAFTADNVPNHQRTPLGYINSARCRRALRTRLEDVQPDIIHLHNFYHELSPGILAELARWRRGAGGGRDVKIVMTAHDYHLVCPNSGLLRYRKGEPESVDPSHLRAPMLRWTSRWDRRSRAHGWLKLLQHSYNYRLHRRARIIDRIICPSRAMQTILDAHGFTTIHIPNPAPDLPAELVETTRNPAGLLHFVFAGRVDPEKGLNRFLHALPADFRGTLEVIGDGAELESCKATVRTLGLDDRVAFSGAHPRAHTLRRIARAHVLVLPSIWRENQPMSLIEALALNTNLLVANMPGPAEIINESGVGYLYDVPRGTSETARSTDDADTLARALARIEQDHASGTLNAFDATPFLAARTSEAYINAVLRVYEGAES